MPATRLRPVPLGCASSCTAVGPSRFGSWRPTQAPRPGDRPLRAFAAEGIRWISSQFLHPAALAVRAHHPARITPAPFAPPSARKVPPAGVPFMGDLPSPAGTSRPTCSPLWRTQPCHVSVGVTRVRHPLSPTRLGICCATPGCYRDLRIGIAAPDPGSGRNYCPGGELSEQPWRP